MTTVTVKMDRSDSNSNSIHSTVGANASRALRYLIDEDPLLEDLQLTSLNHNNNKGQQEGSAPVFAYAAALINSDANENIWTSTDASIAGDIQQKAKDALSEVDRKLILVESLSERISREKPEHVAAPLLKLHGFTPFLEEDSAGGAVLTSISVHFE